jgi:hypothetical protein
MAKAHQRPQPEFTDQVEFMTRKMEDLGHAMGATHETCGWRSSSATNREHAGLDDIARRDPDAIEAVFKRLSG